MAKMVRAHRGRKAKQICKSKTEPTEDMVGCIAIFDHWLKTNQSRFGGHEPIPKRRKKQTSTYRFNGVTKHIWLAIGSGGGCSIGVTHQELFVDYIADFDIAPEKTKSGRYFCRFCIPKYRRYYGSLKELFISEALECLVGWVTKNLLSSKRLLMVDMEGCSYAKILDLHGVATNRRRKGCRLYKVVPVVEDDKRISGST